MGHRTNKLRHPVLQGWAVGEWCPEAVGKVPGYPRTAEAYAAMKVRLSANAERARSRGRLTRRGVPNGYAGEGYELSLIRENARCNAERVTEEVTDDWDDYRAVLAMQAVCELAFDPTVPTKVRLSAARTVLKWTVPKPVARQALKAGGDPIGLMDWLLDRTE
jgi:hypothetical protein